MKSSKRTAPLLINGAAGYLGGGGGPLQGENPAGLRGREHAAPCPSPPHPCRCTSPPPGWLVQRSSRLHPVGHNNFAQQSILCYTLPSKENHASRVIFLLLGKVSRSLFRLCLYDGGVFMSYLVCHMSKFSRGAVRGIQAHNEREKDHSNTNPDIDYTRTNENYNLSLVEQQQLQQMQANYLRSINERVKQLNLPKAVRADAVVMCGFVVTSDLTFFDKLKPEQQRAFFEESYNFLAQRYGKENIISAVVHMDEKTPHMHVELVPVTRDNRLSAKAIFTPQELRQLQSGLHDAVGAKYGLERGVEGSKAKHVETARMKVQDAEKRLAELQKEITPLQAQKRDLEQQIEARKELRGAVIPVKEHKQLLTGKIVEVTMTKEVYDACVSAQHRADHAEMRAREAEQELKRLKGGTTFQEIHRLENALNETREKLDRVQRRTHDDRFFVEKVEAVFSQQPELKDEVFRSIAEMQKGYNQGIER